MNSIQVVAGVRRTHDGRFWICQRKADDYGGGLWEYPGGKINPGEALDVALRREMMEEFGCRAIVGDQLASIETFHRGRMWMVHFFDIAFVEEPKLLVHDDARWCEIGKLSEFPHLPSGEEFNRRLIQKGY